MKRPGYYVENQWFGERFHQARARAAFLAAEYSRPVDLKRVEHESDSFQLVLTVINKKKEVA
jgi:hypothetical protein